MKRKKLFFNGIALDEENAKRFYKEFHGESTRAAVICGFSYIENLLKEILQRKLVEDEEIFSRIEIMGFRRLIDLCYCLGIVSKEEKSDLNILSEIRNEFAHNWEVNSFEKTGKGNKLNSLKVIIHIQKYKYEKSFPTYNLKEKYLSAINAYYLFFHIMLIDEQIKRIKERKTFMA